MTRVKLFLSDQPLSNDLKGYLGDLWYFNASATMTNNSWSLVSGNETLNCPSTLGNSGTPASEQSPACATRIAGWTAGTDDIYFVAGPESGSGMNEGSHYTISSSTWTSLSADGLTSRNDSGAIGGRLGRAYLFGGYGLDSSGFKRGKLPFWCKHNPTLTNATWLINARYFVTKLKKLLRVT